MVEHCLLLAYTPLSEYGTWSIHGYIFLSLILQFLPLPSVAGFYLARFFTNRSLPSYFGFVVLGSLMVTWFVMHNFWDLNIWMAGMSLKSFCKFIIANVVLAMAVPGLAILPSKFHFLIEVTRLHTILYIDRSTFFDKWRLWIGGNTLTCLYIIYYWSTFFDKCNFLD